MKDTSIMRLAVCLALVGCSGSKKEQNVPVIHPVKGQVVYPDGTPYRAGGTIELNAVDNSGGRALGSIDAEGNFTLKVIGNKGQQEGSPAGEFSATIVPDQAQSQGAPPQRARGKYRINPDESNVLKVIVNRTK